ncbi:unnamed protein product [Heligmosomoides polygyrus]|uniref:Reverse transcriptase domain-containing protein n=1 Tax=Heligmosomoides polygyrus TaxID=6339 RepID=A0A183GBP4_HELPZ|nr:unnamed protein product [Heligmosomoides polygyrus]
MVPVATTDAVEKNIGTTAQVEEELGEARIAGKYRTQLSRVIEREVKQTNVREVRTVLGEVQQSQLRPRCRKQSDEEEKMDTNTENDALEVVPESNMIPVYDASGNRMEFLGAVKMKVEIEGGKGTEVAFHISDMKDEEILLDDRIETVTNRGKKGRKPGAKVKRIIYSYFRGAEIRSKREKGHLETDIDMTSKIKFWKDGALCLDEEALQVLSFELTYDAALKKLKKELAEEEKEKRPIKEGPTAFAAPASATLLEEDGPKRGICTRVATSFKQLREVLMEWKANTIWVLVWPVDLGLKKDDIFAIVKACDEHFEEGGRIVGVWPPIVEKTLNKWKAMSEIWTMLDETLAKRAGTGQFVRTASSKIENGHVFCEVGSPESTLYFYGSDCTVGCAKMLYETIRKRICSVVPLPELRRVEFQTMRTSSQEGGGRYVERR